MSIITNLPSAELKPVIEENLQALAQLRAFVDLLLPEHYCQLFGPQKNQSLGKHVRHVVDHYDALLDQDADSNGALLNYEARKRDATLEESPHQASRRLGEIEGLLQELVEQPSRHLLDLAYPTYDTTLTLGSSTARELAFLTSHTIHHMAIMGLLAERLNIELPDTFGVHPSTLRHWQRETTTDAASKSA